MSLLVTEIFVSQKLSNAIVINGADSRITRDGRYDGTRRKLFEVPHLKACVGYCGLAEYKADKYMDDLARHFIQQASKNSSVEQFANDLCVHLNDQVSMDMLTRYASGWHVVGRDDEHRPLFFHIRNFGRIDDRGCYADFLKKYSLSEDFSARDAKSPDFVAAYEAPGTVAIQYYVNGDMRSFHSVWRKLAEFRGDMDQLGVSSSVRTIEDYCKSMRWKFSVIANFYKKFAQAQIIGTPIDVFPI